MNILRVYWNYAIWNGPQVGIKNELERIVFVKPDH